mmetsp:Transcript_17285/g.47559  ORF Transcript_17285/g.47559 Transcript_17285/m.47559 type:complete len:207 (-) Transcript_17285:1176-1796(-)
MRRDSLSMSPTNGTAPESLRNILVLCDRNDESWWPADDPNLLEKRASGELGGEPTLLQSECPAGFPNSSNSLMTALLRSPTETFFCASIFPSESGEGFNFTDPRRSSRQRKLSLRPRTFGSRSSRASSTIQRQRAVYCSVMTSSRGCSALALDHNSLPPGVGLGALIRFANSARMLDRVGRRTPLRKDPPKNEPELLLTRPSSSSM